MTEDEKKAAALLVQICLDKGFFLGAAPENGLMLIEGAIQVVLVHHEYRAFLVATPKGQPLGKDPDELEEIWQEWQNQLAKEGLTSDSTPA